MRVTNNKISALSLLAFGLMNLEIYKFEYFIAIFKITFNFHIIIEPEQGAFDIFDRIALDIATTSRTLTILFQPLSHTFFAKQR